MENNTKISFLKRVKNAIFGLENYGIFVTESFLTALKYFFLLILFVTLVATLAQTYYFNKLVSKGYEYLANELPDFVFEDGVMKFEKNVEAYDNEFDFYLFANTDEFLEEKTIREYKAKSYDGRNGLIILKDKLIYINRQSEAEYKYSDLVKVYEAPITDRQGLIEEYEQAGLASICLAFFTAVMLGTYVSNLVIIFLDLILVAVFGYIVTKFCRVKVKMSAIFSIAVYSLTLSIILSGIYTVTSIFTDFVISYFNVMYLLIAYVYVIASILMIKSDLIKYNQELAVIAEVQKKVKEELKEEEEREKEQQEKEKRKKEKQEKEKEKKEKEGLEPNVEPDGSEI